MKAAELGLVGAAKAAAEALEGQFPGIVFTSGRREVADQARAMSQNVVRNRRWIAQTYSATLESAALQHWIDANPQADTAPEIAMGLMTIMAHWDDNQKARLSKHFSGQAFDVQPMSGDRGAQVIAAIRRTTGLRKFLDHEGGLVRWHAQY
ncbi:hypothetical protein [Phenylobacterium sp.]|jgi:hypothetical protein|uniref:hypothetical protein n=1 Tax=Phenylobacterium sp. TaxID=1871053 RepID=UPI002F3FFE4B